MRIAMAVTAVLIVGAGLGGCAAVDVASTVAGAAGTVVGTAADVGGAVVSGAARTVTGSSGDKESSGN